jgi:hypothetical protein
MTESRARYTSEEKKRIYADTPQEAKKLFETLYGGLRAVPYIPYVVPS